MPNPIVIIVKLCLALHPAECKEVQPEVYDMPEMTCNMGGGMMFLAAWQLANYPEYVVAHYRCASGHQNEA